MALRQKCDFFFRISRDICCAPMKDFSQGSGQLEDSLELNFSAQ